MGRFKIKSNTFIVAEWKGHFFFDLLPTVCFTRSEYYRYTDYGICIAFLVFDWLFTFEFAKKERV